MLSDTHYCKGSKLKISPIFSALNAHANLTHTDMETVLLHSKEELKSTLDKYFIRKYDFFLIWQKKNNGIHITSYLIMITMAAILGGCKSLLWGVITAMTILLLIYAWFIS